MGSCLRASAFFSLKNDRKESMYYESAVVKIVVTPKGSGLGGFLLLESVSSQN